MKVRTSKEDYNFTVIQEFSMPVDNEGVDLTADVRKTEPGVPRPGDDYIEMDLGFTNTGNNPIEELKIIPETPENIETSYSKGEKFYIFRINAGESYSQTLSVNLGEDLDPGTQWIRLDVTYEDQDGNPYSEEIKVPLRIEGRPDLEVVNSSTVMKAGATEKLYVTVRNTGSQDAESVTARIIAERSQPFALADRSNYIGEIKSGETSEAVMTTHQLKVQLRANGDSEEGDHSVYTFTEQTEVEVKGRTQSPLIYVGAVVAALVVLAAAVRYFRRGKSGEEEIEGGDFK